MPSSAPQPEQLRFASDGRTPNSPHPVLVYRQLPLADGDYAGAFENLFDSHLWPAQWRAGVYDYHHYHSTAHEVLGVSRGSARLMLGGEHGQEVEVRAGDALVLPAAMDATSSPRYFSTGVTSRSGKWSSKAERTLDSTAARLLPAMTSAPSSATTTASIPARPNGSA